MTRTTPSRPDRTRAARLPEDVALPGPVETVEAPPDGARRIAAPARTTWDDLFDRPVIELPDRSQPARSSL